LLIRSYDEAAEVSQLGLFRHGIRNGAVVESLGRRRLERSFPTSPFFILSYMHFVVYSRCFETVEALYVCPSRYDLDHRTDLIRSEARARSRLSSAIKPSRTSAHPAAVQIKDMIIEREARNGNPKRRRSLLA
jgi:hypothetical protein